MTIDPSILNNLQQPKFENPMVQYSNYLQMQQAQQGLAEYENKLASTNAFNNAMKKGFNPTTGTYDRGVVRGELINSGQGSLVPTAEKGWAEFDKELAGIQSTKATAAKTQSETVAQKLKFFNDRVAGVRTLDEALALNDAMYADEHVGGFFTHIGGSREKGAAEIRQAAATRASWDAYLLSRQKAALGIEKAMQTNLTNVDQGGTRSLVQTNAYGPAEPKTVATYKVSESPNKPVTNIRIDQRGEAAYTTEAQKLAAQRDIELSNASVRAQDQVSRADRVLDMLEDTKNPVIVGAGAPFLLNVAKVLNLGGGSDTEMIANTETLVADLAKTTLESFQSLGVGARGIDTPKEREFLEKAAGGKLNLDRASLIRLANLARKTAERSSERWGARYKTIPDSARGAYEPPTTVPKRVSIAGIPQAHIDFLRAHPTARGDFEKKYAKTHGAGVAAKVLGE